MPQAAPKPCAKCGVLVRDGGSRCPLHPAPAWSRRPDRPKRETGRRLQAKRAALFSREPLCRSCEAAGRTRLASIRDHVIPLAEGGEDVDSNTQPLCEPCHDAKTQAEAARGRGGSKV